MMVMMMLKMLLLLHDVFYKRTYKRLAQNRGIADESRKRNQQRKQKKTKKTEITGLNPTKSVSSVRLSNKTQPDPTPCLETC